MKKLYFFLMAMLVSVVANATTVYFHNDANWSDVKFYCWGGPGASASWPGTIVTETVEQDGITYYKATTQCPSGIFNGVGGQTPDLQMIDNMIYNSKGATGKSFTGGEIVVEKNFTLAGNFNSYNANDSKYAFTDEGNDIFTLHLDSFSAASDFAVVENGSVWYKYTAGPVESGVEYQMMTAGMDNSKLTGAATDVTFKFNASNNKLTVTYTTGGNVNPVEYSYDLKGNFNGGDNWTVESMTLKDGKWVSAEMTFTQSISFGIRKVSENMQVGWLWSATSANVTEAGSYEVCPETDNVGKNFTISKGTWTFSFDPESMILTITGKAESGDDPVPGVDYSNWYLNVQGDFNNWNPQGVKFNADGTVEDKSLAIGAGEFELKIWNGSKDSYWGTSSEVVTDTPVEVTDGGGHMKVSGATANSVYNVAYNAVTHMMTVTLVSGDQPVEYTYALHGSFTGADWNTINLTEKDGKWVAEDVEVTYNSAAFGIKKLNGNKETWLWSATKANVTEAGTYTVCPETEEGQNFSIATGKWSFSFDPEAMTLVVTGEQQEIVVDYTKWYLNVVGDFNEWKDNGVAFDKDGVAEITDLAIGTSGFKVKVFNAVANKDEWHSNGEAIELNKSYIVEYNYNEVMTLAGATAEALVSVKFNVKTNEMIVTGTTAVAEVEVAEGDAVYYNLQGVQVVNPENGLYVKVVNGKATKVLVK